MENSQHFFRKKKSIEPPHFEYNRNTPLVQPILCDRRKYIIPCFHWSQFIASSIFYFSNMDRKYTIWVRETLKYVWRRNYWRFISWFYSHVNFMCSRQYYLSIRSVLPVHHIRRRLCVCVDEKELPEWHIFMLLTRHWSSIGVGVGCECVFNCVELTDACMCVYIMYGLFEQRHHLRSQYYGPNSLFIQILNRWNCEKINVLIFLYKFLYI